MKVLLLICLAIGFSLSSTSTAAPQKPDYIQGTALSENKKNLIVVGRTWVEDKNQYKALIRYSGVFTPFSKTYDAVTGRSRAGAVKRSCTGPTFSDSVCGNTCSQDRCWDVSYNQDGTLFQCC